MDHNPQIQLFTAIYKHIKPIHIIKVPFIKVHLEVDADQYEVTFSADKLIKCLLILGGQSFNNPFF